MEEPASAPPVAPPEQRIPSRVEAWARGLLQGRVAEFDLRRRAALDAPGDADALHAVRTRARRLRAALEDLRELLPEAQPMLRELRRLGRRTSEARDADVLSARLDHYLATSRGRAHEQFAQLAQRMHRRQHRAYARAIAALETCSLASAQGQERR